MNQSRHIDLKSRCKACQLLNQDLGLFDEVHQKLLIQKQSPAVVAKWLNGRIDVKNLNRKTKIEHFSHQNLRYHLKKHITDEGKLIRDITIPPPPMSHSNFSDLETATANIMINSDSVEEPIPNDGLPVFDTFEESEAASNTLLHSLRFYRFEIEKDLKAGSRPNVVQVRALHETLSAVLQLKTNINKVKNSSKIAGEAIRRMAELISVSYAQQLIEVTGEAEKLLSDQIRGSLPEVITKMIRARMSQGMSNVLESSYQIVIEEFSIK